MQIISVFCGFWDLRCGNILSKTYCTSQKNNSIELLMVYLSNSVNHKRF